MDLLSRLIRILEKELLYEVRMVTLVLIKELIERLRERPWDCCDTIFDFY